MVQYLNIYVYFSLLSFVASLYHELMDTFGRQKYKIAIMAIATLVYFAPEYALLTTVGILSGIFGGFIGKCIYETHQHNSDKIRWKKAMGK